MSDTEETARALGTTAAGLAAIEHTGLDTGFSPGRLGDRFADIEAALEFAIDDRDWTAVATALREIATLRLALDALSFVDAHADSAANA